MFCGCSSLSSLPNLSKWSSEKIRKMEDIFKDCNSLSYLPSLNKFINSLKKHDLFSSDFFLEINKGNINNIIYNE